MISDTVNNIFVQNELACLELMHFIMETLDKYFNRVVSNYYLLYFIII